MPSVGLTYEMADGVARMFQTAWVVMAAMIMFLTQVCYRRDEAQPTKDFINGWLGDRERSCQLRDVAYIYPS